MILLAAAALALGTAQTPPQTAPTCKDASGRPIKCPPKMRPCKPTKKRVCTKVTDYTGRVSYTW